METSIAELENHWFYRLVKVAYIAALICSFFMVFIMGLLFSNSDAGFFQVVFGCLAALFFIYVGLNLMKEGLLYIAFGKKFSWAWLQINTPTFEDNDARRRAQKINLQQLEPMEVALLIVVAFLDKEKPFFGWKPSDLIIPAELDVTVLSATAGYCFYLYFHMLRQKFGKEVSLIIKQHMVIWLNKGDSNLGDMANELISLFENRLDAHLIPSLSGKTPEEYWIALYVLINWKESPCYIPPEKRTNLSNDEWNLLIQKYVSDNAIETVTTCLILVKKLAIEVFQRIIDKITFDPESIHGLDMTPEIFWSENPGCFERQLQRRYKNPLFSPEKRVVSQEEVAWAIKKDESDIEEFNNQTQVLFKFLESDLTAIGRELPDYIIKIDEFFIQAYAIGGKALFAIKTLTELREKIVKILRVWAGNKKDVLKDLKVIEDYGVESEKYFDFSFFQQYIRTDSPMVGERAASILSEDIETIKRMRLATERIDAISSAESLRAIQDECLTLIETMKNRGEDISVYKEKFEALGVKVR